MVFNICDGVLIEILEAGSPTNIIFYFGSVMYVFIRFLKITVLGNRVCGDELFLMLNFQVVT